MLKKNHLYRYPVLLGIAAGFLVGIAFGWWLHPESPEFTTQLNNQNPSLLAANTSKPSEPRPPYHDSARENQQESPITATAPPDHELPPIKSDEAPESPSKKREPDPVVMALGKTQDEIVELAATNPEALTNFILERYETDTELDILGYVADIFQKSDSPDVREYSLQLAKSSNSLERRFGLELLQGYPPGDPAILETLAFALENEDDPETLALAVRTAQPSLQSDECVQRFADRFRALTRHDDPKVRGQSIIQLVAWDKTSPDMLEYIKAGLNDASPEVNSLTLVAVNSAHLQDKTVLDSLWSVAATPSMAYEARSRAVQLLAESPLDDRARQQLKTYIDELSEIYRESELEGAN